MNFKLLRQKNQKEFLKSGAEIEVGSLENLPFDISFLKNITAQSNEIIQVFSSGLTAIVYKICVDKRVYCLKKKRDNILVQNIDGQTSFLNEVQRRRDFYALKKNYPDQFGNIVNTVYASLNHGIILSDWIEGEIISTFNQRNIKSIFKTLFEVEKAGLFECDLSAQNLIVDNNDEVHFFDFGYMYPYNPLVHYNSDGKCNPVFHLAERLETRSLIQYLIDLESIDIAKALNVFKTEKEEAINIYVEKLKWLELLKADNEIITWQRKFIDDWEHGLMSNEKLKDLYDLEMVRSLNLDIQDDISGKSCTTNTIKKADKLLEIINLNFDIVKQSDLIQSPGKNITQGEMLKRHYQIKKTIEKYIIKTEI